MIARRANPADVRMVLQQMLVIMPDAKHRIRNTFARTATGEVCTPGDKNATCFCLDGARWHAGGDTSAAKAAACELARTILEATDRPVDVLEWGKVRFSVITPYNDAPDRTYEEVRSIIEKTSERVERDGLTPWSLAA